MFEKNALNFASKTPLYLQLQNYVKEMLQSKQLVPGDTLPSEAELQQIFGISRSTVRIAFKELEDEGLILRRRGRGTFVSETKLKRNLDSLYSFSADMAQLGLSSSSKILSFQITNCGSELAEKYNMKRNEPLFEFQRIRLADNIPILLEKTIIPVRFCPELTAIKLETESLYNILGSQNNFYIESAVESYEPVNLSKEEMQLLKIHTNTCAFSIQRIAYTPEHETIEITNSVMPGERSKFEIRLYKNEMKISRNYKKEI